ncbi:lipase family protein [Aliikangiella marina]|uniref:Lipase family protein n=1 Tax=Aliikangiella marina TaxID=1712262 RepID=A0A545TGR5_9GAMM|nr:lipase family protein [Aliikangiella marina]TQV76388.1 lipase family protein [Aliikangiella marina]
MLQLSPVFSSNLAKDVYQLTKTDSLEQAVSALKAKYGDILTVADKNMITGKTGGPGIIKSKTAFGFVMLGKGKYDKHAFILFRGTQYLGDWLTNFNIGTSRSYFAQPVHDGFNTSFKSMLPKVKEFVNGLGKDIIAVHCIGHSLGGALATICAEWIKSSTSRSPYLYSFGSPRVGFHGFADKCTKNLGAERIFRAYHKTDIVPCIPFWPFVHTPNAGVDYYLPSPGAVPAAKYHDMDEYIKSVKDKTWPQLSKLKEPKNNASIERWLKKGGPVGFTMAALEWLNDALLYVLKKCLDVIKGTLCLALSSGLTLMDQLAYIFKKGIDISEKVSGWVVYLIRKIMSFLGLSKVVQAADMTTSFIRNIFHELSRRVGEFCQRTLDSVLVDGRGLS